MCDLFSWIELTPASSKKHHGRKVLFLTDVEVAILRGRGEHRWTDDDVVGHTAIEAYYKDAWGDHRESRDKIPPIMAEMVKAGKMDRMIAGILGKDRKKWPKYNKDGTRIIAPDDIDNPEWILKSIVYYCENYTIDGRSLENKTKSAIQTYLNGLTQESGSEIIDAITWSWADEGYDFWDCLNYLIKGDIPNHQPTKVKKWTMREKRMIARMPKVKR